MSAVFQQPDEGLERALFERRARALGAPPGVPSLDAVLRAAQNESGESRRGRRRAWTGMVLAAACLVAVTRTRPRDVSASPGIASDVGVGATVAGEATGGTCEDEEVGSWTVDTRYAGTTRYASVAAVAPVTVDSRACVAPPATFEEPAPLSCEREEANRSEMH